MWLKIPILFILLSWTFWGTAQLATPLPNGHAHNDYEKPWTPLTTALKHGFVSVEIDVFPHKGRLKVAHIGLFLGLVKDIETLYFKPLEAWIKEHGQLFKNPKQRVIFMVDIKRDGARTYQLLRNLCEQYQHLITHYDVERDTTIYGCVDVLLSGHKPYQQVLEDRVRYMRIDGSLDKINHAQYTAAIAPRVSARYGSLFKWRGNGTMPEAELKQLRKIIAQAHADNRKVRFWAMPNKEAVWKLLLDEGVDWMNVDKLERFRSFYENYKLNDKE